MPELAALAPQIEFLCIGDKASFAAMPNLPSNVQRVEVEQTVTATTAASAAGRRSVPDMWRLARAAARLAPSLFFSPSVYSYYPLRPGQRAVVTIHDAIVERFPALTIPSRRARVFWRLKVALAIRQARLILTVSDFAAREIAEVHRVAPSRIRVALEAPAPSYRPASPEEVAAARTAVGLKPGAAWFTYVGGFSPHKRLDVVLRAHAKVAGGPHLLLIGRLRGDAFLTELQALRSLVTSLGTAHLVHWTDFQPDEVIRALHTGAVATLLPSQNEGFGLPAVEAAACGTPVIATTASPLPSLLAGGGLFVRPGDVEAVSAAMQQLLDSPLDRQRLGAAAALGASRLSWRRTAIDTLAALEEAAA